jgi:hypothetical protein
MSAVIVDVLRPLSGRRTSGGGPVQARPCASLTDVLDRSRSVNAASAEAGSAQR